MSEMRRMKVSQLGKNAIGPRANDCNRYAGAVVSIHCRDISETLEELSIVLALVM